MIRMTCTMTLLLGALTTTLGAQPVTKLTDLPTDSAAPVVAQVQPSASAKLGDIIARVDLQDITAREFVDWWSKATGIEVLVNWELLESQGINPRQMVSMQLHDVPAGQVLALAMQTLSNEQVTLMFDVSEHALELLSKADANQRTVTRVYDIATRLQVLDNRRLPRVDTTGYLRGGSSGPGTITFEQRSRGSDVDYAQAKLDAAQKLADELQAAVEPTLWRETGGAHGSVKVLGDKLVVVAPKYVQSRIAEYLGIPWREIVGERSSQPPTDAGSTPGQSAVAGIHVEKDVPVSGVQKR